MQRLSQQTVGAPWAWEASAANSPEAPEPIVGRVLACDPYSPSSDFAAAGAEAVGLDEPSARAREPSVDKLDSPIPPRAEADDREVLVVRPGAKLAAPFDRGESLPVGQREILVRPFKSDLPSADVVLVMELFATQASLQKPHHELVAEVTCEVAPQQVPQLGEDGIDSPELLARVTSAAWARSAGLRSWLRSSFRPGRASMCTPSGYGSTPHRRSWSSSSARYRLRNSSHLSGS